MDKRILFLFFLTLWTASFADTVPPQTKSPVEVVPLKQIPAINTLPPNTPRPLKVGVSFTLNNISKINEFENNYTASIDLKLTWHDPTLAFNPNEYGTFRRELILDQATKLLAKIWNPDVIISNMKGVPINREPCLLIDANGRVQYIQRIRAVFETRYNLAPFPFDTQHLLIQLISNRYNDSEIEFYQTQDQINESGVREGFTLAGWNLGDVDFSSSSIRGLQGKFFPKFQISFAISRKPVSDLFSFAPLLLIVIVPTILTLYADVGIDSRLSTWSGAILALIALSFTLQLRFPALPTNGILGQMIAIIFAYEFLMICLTMSIFNSQLMSQIRNPYLVPQMIKFMKWQIPFIFIIVIMIAVLLTLASA